MRKSTSTPSPHAAECISSRIFRWISISKHHAPVPRNRGIFIVSTCDRGCYVSSLFLIKMWLWNTKTPIKVWWVSPTPKLHALAHRNQGIFRAVENIDFSWFSFVAVSSHQNDAVPDPQSAVGYSGQEPSQGAIEKKRIYSKKSSVRLQFLIIR